MDLCDRKQLEALLERHGFHFSRSMGQNFLIDPAVPNAIAGASLADAGCGVLEIGPGIGTLTVQLAACAGKVVSVELDRTLLPILGETLAGLENVEILPGDVMKLDLPRLVSEKFNGFTPIVCANLPYNITTPILTALLEARCFERITVMLQREAAQRICAAPGESEYSEFSLLCQYFAHPEILFEVPREAFLPAPKVTSAVLRLTPHAAPPFPVSDEAFFRRVVRAAFAQRRKTLLNALSIGLGDRFGKEQIADAIARCGLPETVRGEKLGVREFAQLANILGVR